MGNNSVVIISTNASYGYYNYVEFNIVYFTKLEWIMLKEQEWFVTKNPSWATKIANIISGSLVAQSIPVVDNEFSFVQILFLAFYDTDYITLFRIIMPIRRVCT